MLTNQRTLLPALILTFGCGVAAVNAQNCEIIEVAELLASDAAPGDHFGASSIDGDWAVVGTRVGRGTGAEHPGAVYVFQRNGSTWTEIARLTASDGAPDDWFGASVSIDGDFVIVGAPLDTTQDGDRAGSAYIFEKPKSGWRDMTETCKLTASDAAPHDWFGSPVSIDGDFAIVGAPRDDDAGDASGSAYVFRRDDRWVEQQKLTASDAASGDGFGTCAIDGDIAIVGAWNGTTSDTGAAYVYHFDEGKWNEVAKLTASDAARGDQFGLSVSINDRTVIVGARDNVAGFVDAGSAYVFEFTDSVWVQVAKLTISNPAPNDELGNAVAIDGGLAVVGAARNGAAPGSVYVFEKPSSGWQDMTETHELPGPPQNDRFGEGLSIDGQFLFVRAAMHDTTAGTDAGSVYVFSVECGNQPPVITCNGPVVLWSPDHGLVDVSSTFAASDPDEDPLTLTFRVFSDEPETPETGDGTGRHAPDFKNEHNGGRGLLVRSERRGREDGRYYIFVITADDGNGGVTTKACIGAVVPHDQDQQSRDDVIAQAEAAALVVQNAIDNLDPLPPAGLHEHGLADPLGPKQ